MFSGSIVVVSSSVSSRAPWTSRSRFTSKRPFSSSENPSFLASSLSLSYLSHSSKSICSGISSSFCNNHLQAGNNFRIWSGVFPSEVCKLSNLRTVLKFGVIIKWFTVLNCFIWTARWSGVIPATLSYTNIYTKIGRKQRVLKGKKIVKISGSKGEWKSYLKFEI